MIVLTTLTDTEARDVLELYRYRWQFELAFKRLKSLLQLGHLKKTDPEGAKAWLQGKLWVAALIEMLIAVGERFSPWGYYGTPPQERRCHWREWALMRFLLVQAANLLTYELDSVASAMEQTSKPASRATTRKALS